MNAVLILLNSCHRSPIYKPDGLWIPTPLRGGVPGKGGGVLKLLSPPLAALTPSPTMGGELDTDIDKLWHVFDKKATSYKYFWFLSVLQIYKNTTGIYTIQTDLDKNDCKCMGICIC